MLSQTSSNLVVSRPSKISVNALASASGTGSPQVRAYSANTAAGARIPPPSVADGVSRILSIPRISRASSSPTKSASCSFMYSIKRYMPP